jgi:protoheme IX farnesyltransferase
MTSFILVSVSFGYFYGLQDSFEWNVWKYLMWGCGLLAGSCFAINQALEVAWDSKMERTQNRPLPQGILAKWEAWVFGTLCFLVGFWFLWNINLMTAILGASIVLTYCFWYTPSKRWNSLNTLIGAIPGAIPPLVGWTAARGNIDLQGGFLFVLLFSWQLPHFLAIAWLYRNDYKQGGYAMLPVVEDSGQSCFRQILIQTGVLILVSLFPFAMGLAGYYYLLVALLAGGYFLYMGIQLYRSHSDRDARSVFRISLLYLPAILFALIWDRAVFYV